jgi:hypothetical protein
MPKRPLTPSPPGTPSPSPPPSPDRYEPAWGANVPSAHSAPVGYMPLKEEDVYMPLPGPSNAARPLPTTIIRLPPWIRQDAPALPPRSPQLPPGASAAAYQPSDPTQAGRQQRSPSVVPQFPSPPLTHAVAANGIGPVAAASVQQRRYFHCLSIQDGCTNGGLPELSAGDGEGDEGGGDGPDESSAKPRTPDATEAASAYAAAIQLVRNGELDIHVYYF